MMPDLLEIPAAEILLAWLLTYLLHSTLLIGGLWLLATLFWPRLKQLTAPWKGAVVGGLLTSTLSLTTGAGFDLGAVPALSSAAGDLREPISLDLFPEMVDEEEREIVRDRSLLASGSSMVPEVPEVESSSLEELAPAGMAPASPSKPSDPSFSPAGLLTLLVVALPLAGLLRVLLLVFEYRRDCRSLGIVREGRVVEILEKLRARTGLKRSIRVCLSDRLRSPVALGLFRATIALPRDLVDRLDDDALEALLAHELAHVRHGDLGWSWLGRALCLVLPVQPLNLLAFRLWGRAAEYRCDRWAVSRGVSALALARCLTEVAAWRGPRRGIDPAVAMAVPGSQLAGRVRSLLEPDFRDRRRGEGIAILLIAFTCGLLAGLGPYVGRNPSSPVKEVEETSERRFEAVVLREEDPAASLEQAFLEIEELRHELELLHEQSRPASLPREIWDDLRTRLRERGEELESHARALEEFLETREEVRVERVVESPNPAFETPEPR